MSRKTTLPAEPQTESEPTEQLPVLRRLIEELLIALGEDTERQGLVRTPDRVARSWVELTQGYEQSLDDVVGHGIFDAMGSEMVVVRDIEVMSLCEHHLLPFYGRCHVAYLPKDRILGLSKVARIVDMFARRLQVQERLTTQIAAAIEEVLDPHGVGVVIEAKHMCMMMRGVEKAHSETATSSVLGKFREDPKTRAEFLSLVPSRIGG